eukprot:5321350-Karenia_brevis.AAC.1
MSPQEHSFYSGSHPGSKAHIDHIGVSQSMHAAMSVHARTWKTSGRKMQLAKNGRLIDHIPR